MSIVEVGISDEQRHRASTWFGFGALNNSITEGRSNIYGALGEVLFADHYPQWWRCDTRDADFQHDRHGTVDIKTKRTTATPAGHWNCSVAATSLHQSCDLYYFLRVHERKRVGWFLGWITHDDLFERGTFRRQGEPDGRGWSYRADCWNIRVDRLNPVRVRPLFVP